MAAPVLADSAVLATTPFREMAGIFEFTPIQPDPSAAIVHNIHGVTYILI